MLKKKCTCVSCLNGRVSAVVLDKSFYKRIPKKSPPKKKTYKSYNAIIEIYEQGMWSPPMTTGDFIRNFSKSESIEAVRISEVVTRKQAEELLKV